TSAVKKSVATNTSRCVRMNSFYVVVVFLRRGRLPIWRRRKAMPLEDVPHGLVTHGVSEVGQCPDNPIIAPRAILLGHANTQGLQLCSDLRTSTDLTLRGTIELLGDQLTVPCEDRVGC